MKKRIGAAVASSCLVMLLSASFGTAGRANNIIDAPKPLVTASLESSGKINLVAASANMTIRGLDHLPDGRRVRLDGTVESIQNDHEFILRDGTGTVDVSSANRPANLHKGSEVTVLGRIDKGLLGANIEARSVMVRPSRDEEASALGDKLTELRVMPLKEAAVVYPIQKLPEQGLVKVFGTVTTANNDKEFTLKDATGLVDVDVGSEDATNIMKGSKVSVTGYIDRGLLGKDINASKVVVVENAPSVSTQ